MSSYGFGIVWLGVDGAIAVNVALASIFGVEMHFAVVIKTAPGEEERLGSHVYVGHDSPYWTSYEEIP